MRIKSFLAVIAVLLASANSFTQTKKFVVVGRYEIVVDTTQLIKKIIDSCRFDAVDREIVRQAPSQNAIHLGQKYELQILYFDGNVNSEEVLLAMSANNLEPANILEAGYFTLQYPKNKKQFLVFLGTVWFGGGRRDGVPILDYADSNHYLYLIYVDVIWDYHFRFAAVKKSEK